VGEPVVANGFLLTLSNGHSTKSSAFSILPAVTRIHRAGGFQIVTAVDLLGGLTFTATLVTAVVTDRGQPVVLVGATVTDSAGYSGVVPSGAGAGTKYTFT
jgi:hypothetical protein